LVAGWPGCRDGNPATRQPENYFSARFEAFAKRDLYRLAVFFLITPDFAALSTAEKPPESTDASTLPSDAAMVPRVFLSVLRRRDFAARLRSLRFSACSLCF